MASKAKKKKPVKAKTPNPTKPAKPKPKKAKYVAPTPEQWAFEDALIALIQRCGVTGGGEIHRLHWELRQAKAQVAKLRKALGRTAELAGLGHSVEAAEVAAEALE